MDQIKKDLDNDLKTFTQKFELFHGYNLIHAWNAKDNSKTLSDHGLTNGDKIMISTHPQFEVENYTFDVPTASNKFYARVKETGRCLF